MPIYNLLLLLCWAAFIAVWVAAPAVAERRLGGNVLLGAAIRVAVIVVILLLVSVSGLDLGWLEPSAHPLLAAIGIACAALGIAFAIWARLHLGRNWAMPMTERQDTELVTTGPYAYVRHPIYTGVLLALFGSALVAGPWWLFMFLAAAAYFVYSARQEEGTLADRFPAAYPAYRRRTKMLVPFLF